MRRSVNDPTMRIALFYQNAPSVHVSSRVVNDLNPDVLDLAVHHRLAQACEEEGLDFLFIADQWGKRRAGIAWALLVALNLIGWSAHGRETIGAGPRCPLARLAGTVITY